MKSFGNFGALTSLFLVLANLSSYTGSVQAAVLPRDGILPPINVPIDLIPDYFKLLGKCNEDPAAVRILDPALHWLTFSNVETD